MKPTADDLCICGHDGGCQVTKQKHVTYAFQDGFVVHDDIMSYNAPPIPEGLFPLVVADPPYGGIVSDKWDRIEQDQAHANWMCSVAGRLSGYCCEGAAMYWWGGYGKPLNRPFYRFVVDVELATSWRMANMITWKKKRAYGVQHNYLSTREECAYFIKGDIKKPRMFNIPLLDKERGYAGYNSKYPAKSKFLRRTSVWDDVTEILRGKVHTAQKPERLAEIMIEVHTKPGEWVLDPFAGSGSTAIAALNLGRRFVLVENDPASVGLCCKRIKEWYESNKTTRKAAGQEGQEDQKTSREG